MDITKERQQINRKLKELQERRKEIEARKMELKETPFDLTLPFDKLIIRAEFTRALIGSLDRELSTLGEIESAIEQELYRLSSYEALARHDRNKDRLRKKYERTLAKVEEADNPIDEQDHLQALTEVEQERRKT